jgi:hypothetical protein
MNKAKFIQSLMRTPNQNSETDDICNLLEEYSQESEVRVDQIITKIKNDCFRSGHSDGQFSVKGF